MPAAVTAAQLTPIPRLGGGLSDKAKPALVRLPFWTEMQNFGFQGESLKKRSGHRYITRKKARAPMFQFRREERPLGENQGLTLMRNGLTITPTNGFLNAMFSNTWTIEILLHLDKHPTGTNVSDLFTSKNGNPSAGVLNWQIQGIGTGSPRKLVVAHRNVSGTVTTLTSASDVPLGVPVMISLVHTMTTTAGDTLILYFDGVLEASDTAIAGADKRTLSITGQPGFGHDDQSSAYSYGLFGRLGEIRCWSLARSAALILANIRRQLLLTDRTGLFAYYPMNKAGKYEIEDESGHQNKMFTVPFVPRFTNYGLERSGYYFDGSWSNILIPVTGGFWSEFLKNIQGGTNQKWTIELGWTPTRYANGVGALETILDFRYTALVAIKETGVLEIRWYTAAADGSYTATNTTIPLNPGQRYMISLVRTNTLGTCYIDGASDHTVVLASTATGLASDSWCIGGGFDQTNKTTSNMAAGYLDELRFWGRDISSASVGANFSHKLPTLSYREEPSGQHIDGKFTGYKNTRIVRGGPGADTTFDTTTFLGQFNNDGDGNAFSFMVFLKDGTVRHIASTTSTVTTLSTSYNPGLNANNGLEAAFTKLLLLIDGSVNTLDFDAFPLVPRLARVAASSEVPQIQYGAAVQFDSRSIAPALNPNGRFNLAVTNAGMAAPLDLLPRFEEGFATATEQPVLGEFFWKRSNGDRFHIAGAGHSLYWNSDRWSRFRPFSAAKDPNGASLLLLNKFEKPEDQRPYLTDAVKIPHASNKGIDFPTGATRTFEFWLYPFDVGPGFRTVLSKISDAGFMEYVMGVINGDLVMQWNSDGGTKSRIVRTSGAPVKTRQWQHVAFTVTQDGVTAAIYWNGASQPQTVTGTVGTADTTTNALYIGHDPNRFNPVVGAVGPAYFGHIDELRISKSIRYSGVTFDVPDGPFSDDANTVVLIHFDDAQDVIVTDSKGLASPETVKAHGELTAEPWIPIAKNLDSNGITTPWRFSASRDRLFATNGVNFPVRIDHGGQLAAANLGFTVTRMGIKAPAVASTKVSEAAGGLLAASSTFITRYTYFNSRKGIESGPSPQLSFVTGGSAAAVKISLVPSDDSQVDTIRIYLSQPFLSFTFRIASISPETREFEINVDPATVGAGAALDITNGEAPKAKFLLISGDRSFMANTPGFPNSFAASHPDFEEVFDPLDTKNLNSRYGEPLSGLSASYGRIYAHQPQTVFAASPSAKFLDFSIQEVQVDQGALDGGAMVNVDGTDYFRTYRSIVAFSGSQNSDIAQPIESSYRGRSEDLTNFPGFESSDTNLIASIFWPGANEIWFTGRRRGTVRNDLILIQNLTAEAKPWTIYKGPQLSTLIVGEDIDGKKVIFAGTYQGYIVQLETGQIDGSVKPKQTNDVSPVVTGAVQAGSTTTSIVTLGTLDTLAEGHSGVFLTVIRRNAAGEITQSDRKLILSNTSTTITLEDALSFTPAAGDTWTIGAIEAFATSGWLDMDDPALSKKWEYLDLVFRPITGSLEIYWKASAGSGQTIEDVFTRSTAARKSASLTKGFTEQVVLDKKNRGKLLRFQLYEIDSEVSPEIYSAALRWEPETVGHGA